MTQTYDHGGNIFSIATSLGIAPEDLIDFSASINPLGFAPGVRQSIISGLDRIIHYPDSSAEGLRQALAGWHGMGAGNILVANGSTELIYLVPRMVPGARGLIIGPAFSEYAKALAHAGMESDFFLLDPAAGFELSLECLDKRLADRVDVLFLCNPGNPTGKLLPRHIVAEVLDLCRARGVFMVLDEAFMDFCEADSAKRLSLSDDRLVVLRSMTKFFAIPGLRVGYAIAAPEVIGRLEALSAPWSVNSIAQTAGLAALADSAHISQTLRYVAEERSIFASELADIDGLTPYPSAVNYLLVKISKGCSSGMLQRLLLQKHILVRNCANFPGLDDSFFRVAVRTREENMKFLSELRGILGKRPC
jgi:threonine-phosphate decarboxylase